MRGEKCLVCNRKVSISNLRNYQCKTCKKYCHPKCARTQPPPCLQKCGAFRYRIIRSSKWECETCILRELPFWDLLNYQVKALNPRFILPCCDELNDKFIHEKNDENVCGDDFEFTYLSNQTNYSYSNDISSLDFSDEAEPF